jgi:hypothetical protein
VRSWAANCGTSPSTTAAVSLGKGRCETAGSAITPVDGTVALTLPTGRGAAARGAGLTADRTAWVVTPTTASTTARIDSQWTGAGRRGPSSNTSSPTSPSHHRLPPRHRHRRVPTEPARARSRLELLEQPHDGLLRSGGCIENAMTGRPAPPAARCRTCPVVRRGLPGGPVGRYRRSPGGRGVLVNRRNKQVLLPIGGKAQEGSR